MNEQERILLVKALSRAGFLLWRIAQGDHAALENAVDAAEEARDTLRIVGEDEEWFAEVDEEELLRECDHPNAVHSDSEPPESWHCPDCGEDFTLGIEDAE